MSYCTSQHLGEVGISWRLLTLQSRLFLTQKEHAGCSNRSAKAPLRDQAMLPSVHFRLAVLESSLVNAFDVKPYLHEIHPRWLRGRRVLGFFMGGASVFILPVKEKVTAK
jgi:hypothetical protein